MNLYPKALALAVGSVLLLMPLETALAAPPSISYSGTNLTPFSTISVSASGFSGGETVQISLGLATITATADAGGNISGTQLTIPSLTSGLYYIIAVGQTSGAVAFTSLFVEAFYPTASPSGWYITPGSTMTWTGSGFAPSENIRIYDASNTQVASFAADASGSFASAGGIVLPYTLRGSTAVFTLRGDKSGASMSFTVAISDLYPYVSPSSWYAVPGSQISFTGGGFGPGEEIGVYLGASQTALAHIDADAAGSFSEQGSVTLPFGSLAEYRLVGHESGVIATAPVTLSAFYPSLIPSTYYAPPGGSITLLGSGFAGGESISVSINEAVIASSTTTTAGDFGSVSLTVPATPNSSMALQARGASSGATASIALTIGQYYPNVTPTAWFTYPGNSVTFSGNGFAPNETITMSGALSGTATTDSSGTFSGIKAVIPFSASGSASFTFTGSESQGSQTISIALGARSSAIWFDNYYAQGGSPLTVFGSGFGSSEKVTLSAGGAVFANVTADENGDLAGLAAIPFAPAGSINIEAVGETTGAQASASLEVAPVYIDFQLGSYAVSLGSPINLIGKGFLPGEPVTLTTDRTGTEVVASFNADSNGNFNNSSFSVPSDWTSGNLTVTIRGGNSFTESSVTLWVDEP